MADEEEVQWHPSGWYAVYVGGKPGEPGARLVGHTRETIATNVTTRFTLTSPVPRMHGSMIAHPHRHDDGRRYWAWQLEREQDVPHVPDFRPIRH